ncbi:EamA family transporter [Moorellaceae bacterium AZ2]
MKIYLLVALNVLLLVGGQILWKLGISQRADLKAVVMALFTPYILGGLILYAIATVLWLYILSREQLSIVYPLQSTAYALGVLAAWLIFKEAIPLTRWIGVLFIFMGAAFIAMK